MSEPLWRWKALCTALGLPPTEGPTIHGISIDSRTVARGDLFLALTGDPGPRFNPSQRSNRDGHDFIDAALAAGAAGVVSHDQVLRAAPELKVADTLDGLWDMGRAGRARLHCPVVAITGSSGKTTCKTFLAAALGAFATGGSLNNHLGVPLSLARTPEDAASAVYELGTNHPGEIGPLSELVQPTLCVLLNVHQAHAENFPDRQALIDEKLSIINGLNKGSYLVVEDAIELHGLGSDVRVLTFGESGAADVRLLGMDREGARYSVRGRRVTARVPGGGRHRALSLAAVLGVLSILDRELMPALSLPESLIPRGRGNRLSPGGVTLIDDSYNANPASMTAALKTLQEAPGRRFALLGEMLELGAAAESAHAGLAPYCAGLDGVYLVGEGMRALADRLPDAVGWWATPDEALQTQLAATLRQGDTLLVKGSNRVFWARGFVDAFAARLTS